MAETERLRLLAQARQRRAAANSGNSSGGMTIIATTEGGGRIYQTASGQRGFTSPGYSTTDPAKVAELMEGATPAQIVQADVDNQVLSEAPVASRAASIAQGFPFVGSHIDDALGGAKGNNVRMMQGAMERQNPVEAIALNVGGAVMGSIPAAVAAAPAVAAAAPTSLAAQAGAGLAAGAAVGATEGAVYGSGEGQSAAERIENAKMGALIGGAAGSVLGGAAPYASAGLRNLIGKLRGSDVNAIARELNTSHDAARVIKSALENGDEQAAMAALQRAGGDAMIADAGPSASGLLDAVAQTPGNGGRIATRAVQERTQAASSKITEALDRTLGAPQGERELIDAVRSGSAPARSQAYDAAYAAPIDYSAGAGRRIEALLGRVPASAIRKAQQIMDLREETSAQIMAQIADNGAVTFTEMPDVRQVHYIMQALDDLAKGTDGAGTFGRQNTYGASVEGLRSQLGQALKRAVPEFSAAQDIAADTARQIELTEVGYDMLKSGTRREDVARALQGASRAERTAAQQGVRAYLDDTMANVARTMTDPDTTTREGIKALRDMSSRANQTKLRVLLGRDAADDLLSEVDEAATAFELRSAIAQNSKTAVRQAVQGSVDEIVEPGVVRTIMSGEPINATKRMIQALTGETAEAQELRKMGLYEDIATALTDVRGGRARAALRHIQLAMNGQSLSDTQARLIANALTGSAVLSGSHATTQALQ